MVTDKQMKEKVGNVQHGLQASKGKTKQLCLPRSTQRGSGCKSLPRSLSASVRQACKREMEINLWGPIRKHADDTVTCWHPRHCCAFGDWSLAGQGLPDVSKEG